MALDDKRFGSPFGRRDKTLGLPSYLGGVSRFPSLKASYLKLTNTLH